MRKHMKRILFLTAWLTAFTAIAQQVPHYTQFMYNMNVVNPAYAGIKNGFAGGLLYRTQWAGAEGHPRSFTLNLHSRLGERAGVGLAAIADRYAFTDQTDIMLQYSYTLPLTSALNLAMGLNVGVGRDFIDLTQAQAVHPADPLIKSAPDRVVPTYGLGLMLYSEKFYVSLSAPNLNQAPYKSPNFQWNKGRTLHYFGAAGYVFDISDNFKIKPHVMVYKANGSPVSTMLNTNFFLYDMVEIGASYRIKDAVSGLINVNINDYIRIGYAYDRTLSSMKLYSPNTHEVFLNFLIPYTGKTAVMSPLYF